MDERKFRRLKPIDKRCTLEVAGGLNRPPLERTREIVALFKKARSLAAELGVELADSSIGGGSDGNFTAALGIPTLDGIGAVGEGAHTPTESILVTASRIARPCSQNWFRRSEPVYLSSRLRILSVMDSSFSPPSFSSSGGV